MSKKSETRDALSTSFPAPGFSEAQELWNLRYALNRSSILAMTDTRGTITYVNDKFCEISKYSREELLGQDHQVVNSGYHTKEFFRELWRTIARGEVWHGEICNRAKDESIYWVETTIVPFLGDDGRPYQYLAIRKDITDRKLAQQAVEEERSKTLYAEKMAALGEMAAGIAHELGNPLGALRGRLEMLQFQVKERNFDPQYYSESIEKMVMMVDRMSTIIRSMRSYARDGSKDPFSRVLLNDVVRSVLDFSVSKFARLQVESRLAGFEKEIWIEARETELVQVILNLLNNACDAVLLKESPARWVEIELSETDEEAIISIKDTGPGVPDDVRAKIMEPFFTTKPGGAGTGLGLSISKAIVESHMGTIRLLVGTNPTTFQVTLPKRQ